MLVGARLSSPTSVLPFVIPECCRGGGRDQLSGLREVLTASGWSKKARIAKLSLATIRTSHSQVVPAVNLMFRGTIYVRLGEWLRSTKESACVGLCGSDSLREESVFANIGTSV